MDSSRQGLAPAQVSRLTGRVDSNAPASLSAPACNPANMGPGNAQGKQNTP